MPAASEKQRRAMALAHAIKTGQSHAKPRGAVKSLLKMSAEQLHDFMRKKTS